jgi:hypothetical protein
MSEQLGSEMETSATPTQPVKAACCPWRTAMQTPMLLIAAAGLGFAGQQAWHSGGDLSQMFASPSQSACSAIAPTTPCAHVIDPAMMAGLSASGGGCCSSKSAAMVTAGGCCSSGSAEVLAEATEDDAETVSALVPANSSDESSSDAIEL